MVRPCCSSCANSTTKVSYRSSRKWPRMMSPGAIGLFPTVLMWPSHSVSRHVTTARSKGLSERDIVMKHVVRNALIPVVTLVALQMPIVFGGAIVTEQIFRIPGIGSLLIDAILRNDTPVIMAVTFVFSCLVIFFNLVADLLYGWLDPRISFR